MSKLYDWMEDRTGVRRISRAIFDEPIRGGARFAYVFGSALIFIFLLQGVTGIFLTMYYVPSADHAHASVAYIEKVVTMGRIVRGLHVYGSSAMIVLLLGHIVQTFLFGAYKQRRELLWVVGVVMMLVVLGFAFTGYLLPWDQEAYFGTKVGTSVAEEVPMVGDLIQGILLGGHELTTLTLSRFFVIHIFLLPILLTLFVVVHLYFFRRTGAAGPYHHGADTRIEFFYPNQLFKDTLFIFVVFLILFGLAIGLPARLGPQADPTSDYLARPPWYFLPLFQLLKYFPGKLAMIPTTIFPGLLLGLLFLLPFVDRRAERHPLRRPIALAVMGLALGGSVVLAALSKYEDARNPDFTSKLSAQTEEARAFLQTPFFQQQIGRSVPVNPPVVKNPPIAGSRVLKIYLANCANCHGADALGGPMAPSLVSLARTQRLTRSFILDYLAGHKREAAPGSMPKFNQLLKEDREAIADWLMTLDQPVRVHGAVQSMGSPPDAPTAFAANCSVCHGDHGQGNIGPSLVGISAKPNRQREDILEILHDSRKYGLRDPMPASFPMLSDDDRKQIADWLSKFR